MEGTKHRRMTSTGGTAVRRVLAFATIGLAALLGGCIQDGLMDMARFQLKPDDIIIEHRPDAEYEKLFPYYVELCAASQFQSKLTGEGGGPAGHAIIYIKGACNDENTPFPQLRRCRGVATSLKDPEHGAGVSVNQLFKNVNWVATPGYELVFSGGPAPRERLTLARFRAVEQQAIAKGIYRGVTFHRFEGASRIPSFAPFWRELASAPIWRCNLPDRCFARGFPSPRPCWSR